MTAHQLEKYTTRWQSPSNIALVKYWGKKEGQIPANPSISFSLDQATTVTQVDAIYKPNQRSLSIEFTFENKPFPLFEPKLKAFLEQVMSEFEWINNYHLIIESSNTFPHSSGIASSASSFSALALCLCSLNESITGLKFTDFFQTASFWARIGSGSACRSIYSGYSIWGEIPDYEGSNDKFAVDINKEIHPIFKDFSDTILIIEKGKKAVSSSEGHELLKQHPFAEKRYQLGKQNTALLLEILKQGDLDGFIQIVESEALMLHALMLTSAPPFILMKPNTLSVIEKIKTYRKQTGAHVLFTLDAGANVHLLNPAQENEQIQEFVKNELVGFCQNEMYFCNKVGNGPVKL